MTTAETGLSWVHISKKSLGSMGSLMEARRRLGEIVGASSIIGEHEDDRQNPPSFCFKLTDRAMAQFRRDGRAFPEWRILMAVPVWEQRRAAGGAGLFGRLAAWAQS